MPTSANDTSQSADGFFATFSLSNNLVDVGALTALIGSSVAESLVLGNRGAAGVAWAATSSFGTISVVKACFCGASSGWLRETLGIRILAADQAVGLELPWDSSRATKVRQNIGEPLAIFCRIKLGTASPGTGSHGRWSDVYALDHSTSLMLRGIPDSAVGDPLQVYTYAGYDFVRPYSKFQAAAVILSAAKLAEVYVLWRHGSLFLGMTSATPWVYFFIGAIVIHAHDLFLGRNPEPEFGGLDIVAGHLPMVSRQGGPRKIVLGVAENERASLLWRFFWAAGAVVSAISIVLSYILMGSIPRPVVFLWTGFQLLWLGVRILIYHFADPTNPMALRILVPRNWATLSPQLKTRVMDLTLGLSRLQILIHPRGQAQYADDTVSTSDLPLISDGLEPPNLFPLPDKFTSSYQIEIKAVFGDTSLSSATWITGVHTSPMDLYDSCIVVFSIRQSNHAADCRSVAVPSARVLSSAMKQGFDSEKGMQYFVPKGAPNNGQRLSWWYWIPCQTGLWLQLQVPTQRRTVGTHQADIRTDAQVSAFLSAGNLNIGLKDVDELKGVVDLSRKARESFLELLG